MSVAGKRLSDGSFASRTTVHSFCSAFSHCIQGLLSDAAQPITLDNIWEYFPIKQFQDPPRAHHDGGGIPSQPDWSAPPQRLANSLSGIRLSWLETLSRMRADRRVVAHALQQSSEPLFTDSEVQEFRASFFQTLGIPSDASIWQARADQPYAVACTAAPFVTFGRPGYPFV